MNEKRNRCFGDWRRSSLRLGVALLLILVCAAAGLAQSEFRDVNRIVAIGDLHGGFDELVSLLRGVGLIDGRNKWKGGNTHFVQTGDVVDRGADSRKILDLLMDLQEAARKDGGIVHALLGNHETMNVIGDLRYVDHGEYDAFKTADSNGVRDLAYEQLADPARKDDRRYRSKWEDEHPLGWVERRQAFGKDGKYGKWLRQCNTVVKINDVLFVHGGLGPKYLSWSLDKINDRVREELQDFSKLKDGVVTDPEGPLWYRDFAASPAAEVSPHIDKVLTTFGVNHIVVAHTPTPGIVLPRFGGKVILIDVGLSKVYGEGRACLIFEGGKPFAFHRGTKLPLPMTEDPAAFMQYLRSAEFLEPPDSHLHSFVNDAARSLGKQ